jgi:hypothetical protein
MDSKIDWGYNFINSLVSSDTSKRERMQCAYRSFRKEGDE